MPDEAVNRDPAELRLLGGHACLDFCNTVDPREGPRPYDFLSSYFDLVAWAAKTGLISEQDEHSLRAEARERPAAAQAAVGQALELREALYRIFSSVANGEPAEAADLEIFNGAFRRASAHVRLAASHQCFAWSWRETEDGLDRTLWLVAQSAVELLTSNELQRVRKCPGRSCGWLFLDVSKNRSRRWCSMDGCGSRAKMRGLYARRRAQARGER